MNQRIRELADQAAEDMLGALNIPDEFCKKFAELIVEECLSIVKNREDELESAGLIEESNTVGVVAYRISRQFGVE